MSSNRKIYRAHSSKTLKRLWATHAGVMLKVLYAGNIFAIKGIGMVTAAIIISEISDISRFKYPRQILKTMGLNLRENSSGKHKGKATISMREKAAFCLLYPNHAVLKVHALSRDISGKLRN